METAELLDLLLGAVVQPTPAATEAGFTQRLVAAYLGWRIRSPADEQHVSR